MNGVPQNAQFTEHGNTGAGAINTSITGVTVIADAAEAAKYAEFTTIFADTNGLVKYADAWDGQAGAKITTETINFAINPVPSVTVGELYADLLTWSGKGTWNSSGNSIQVGTDTVITMKKPGKVLINWFSGQGTDDDALITYDSNGCATVKIVRSTGKYIISLTLNTANIPAESQTCEVSFNLNYDGAPAATTQTAVIGQKVIKPENPTRSGFNFEHWATADGTEYDFDTLVTGALELKAVWRELSEDEKNPVITSPTTISFGSSGNYKTLMSSGKVAIASTSDPRDNGGNNTQLYNDTSVTLKVNVGAKITVSSYSGYTNYSVTVNGTQVSAHETGTSYSYTVTANKEGENYAEVVFTSVNNDNYFYSIAVSYGLTEISENKTFNEVTSVESTSEIEFTGVTVHNSNSYWDLGTSGTIKIKVAAGATIKLKSNTWGIGIAINGVTQTPDGDTITYVSAAGGEITIGCIENASNRSYLQSIEVSFGA